MLNEESGTANGNMNRWSNEDVICAIILYQQKSEEDGQKNGLKNATNYFELWQEGIGR